MKNFFNQQRYIGFFIILLLVAGAVLTATGFHELAANSIASSDWHFTYRFLIIFLILAMVTAAIGAFRGPSIAGILVAVFLSVALGAAIPVAVVMLLTLSAYAMGRLLLRAPGIAITDCLLAGTVVFGTMLSVLVHLPINNAGTWGILFSLPLLVGWSHVRKLFSVEWKHPVDTSPHLYILSCAIVAAALLHFLVGLLPEIGHDALVTHLFVPAHVAHHQSWHFNTGIYVWAILSLFVDCLYGAGYIFAGETGARLVNVGSILLLAIIVHRLAMWAGAGKVTAAWAVLLLLVTPLTFTESSSLFIEGIWTALVVAGTFALLRLVTKQGNPKTETLVGALLLGGALAAKAVTFTLLPVLVILLLACSRSWFSRDVLPVAGIALLIFLAVGAIPYVTAYALTGNPVFPFFNAYFQSPLYPAKNFSPPVCFERGVAWNTLYRITFDSGKYLEASIGASGFQYLLLVLPGVIVLALSRHYRGLLLALLATAWLCLVFSQTAYLRYVFPAFALTCVIVATAMEAAASASRCAWGGMIMAAAVTVVLNLMHFHSGSPYKTIDLSVIIDKRAREYYIERNVPVRTAVGIVNELNRELSPVAFFSAPLTAELRADALYANWYNPRYLNAVLKVDEAAGIGTLLALEGVDYVVVDDAWKQLVPLPYVNAVTTEVARVGTISVRRLNDDYRYKEELLSSPNFTSGWHLMPGAASVPGGGVKVSVESPAYTPVTVQALRKYRYIADACCFDGPAEGRLQVNWLRPDGGLASADIKVFDCKSETMTYTMDVRAPADATHALVYAASHTSQPVVFTRISFRN